MNKFIKPLLFLSAFILGMNTSMAAPSGAQGPNSASGSLKVNTSSSRVLNQNKTQNPNKAQNNDNAKVASIASQDALVATNPENSGASKDEASKANTANTDATVLSESQEQGIETQAPDLLELLGEPPAYIKADFETIRYIKQGGRVFKSSGVAEISKEFGVCWRMEKPRLKTYWIGGEKHSDAIPGLDFLNSLVSGDTAALDQSFSMGFSGTAEAGTVFFRPRGDLSRVIFSVNAVFKNRLLESVTAINQDGGSTVVKFSNYDLAAPQEQNMENFCRE